MGEVVNLRRARKARVRAEAAGAAELNRARFGRTAGECAATAAAVERQNRALDLHRLDPGRDEPQR